MLDFLTGIIEMKKVYVKERLLYPDGATSITEERQLVQWCGDEEIRTKTPDTAWTQKKLSDLGEKSNSKREEPAISTKELLLEKTGMGESSSGRGVRETL